MNKLTLKRETTAAEHDSKGTYGEKPKNAPTDIHPSIMMNRVGVYYRNFTPHKKPQTILEKCCYFSAIGRLPNQETHGNDAFTSMKQNALEWFNAMNNEERVELERLYWGLPPEWR